MANTIEIEDFPEHLRILRNDWHVVFNPISPPTFDLERSHDLTPDSQMTFCACISPDDAFLAVGCDGGVRIYCTDTGQLQYELMHGPNDNGECDIVTGISFFADGRILAAGGEDGHIRLWDIDGCRVLHTFVGNGAPVCCMDMCKDSNLLVSASKDHTVRLWNCQSNEQVAELMLNHCINSLSLAANQQIIAVGTSDGVVMLDFPGCQPIAEIKGDEGHNGPVQCVAFSPSGEQLATAGLDSTVKTWFVGSAGVLSCMHTLDGHKDTVVSVCWATNGRWVISCSKDRSIQIWDTESRATQAVILAHRESISSVASASKKCLFVTAGADSGRTMMWSYLLCDVNKMTPTTESTHDQSSTSKNTLLRPGHGLPLLFLPSVENRFPVLVGDNDHNWTAATLHIREICMLKMLDDLTDKSEWWLKVRDPEIVAKWKSEAVAMDWDSYHKHGDFTNAMADACIQELRQNAELYENTGLVPVYNYSACAIKSDSIAQSLYDNLKAAVSPLENVPSDQMDWHPGSQGKVLDLVHPSLWPLIYGRTRIITNDTIDIQTCLESFGRGEFIQQSLPAWDTIYRWPKDFAFQRLRANEVGPSCTTPDICRGDDEDAWYQCVSSNRPLNQGETPREDDEAFNEGYEHSARAELDEQWFEATHPLHRPDAKPEGDSNTEAARFGPEDVKSSGYFNGASRIQVIVKLANIHLTPENPSYDGGSWHIEGQQNEHICATALFYYDNFNITDSRLAFRTNSNREDLASTLYYKQWDYKSISHTFAINAIPEKDSTVQNIGSVLTRQGRALFFPNLYQHRVQHFSLADTSRPGHRKILALFLVDPAIPIISTANVPPQQPHWKTGDSVRMGITSDDATIDSDGDCIDLAEAKRIRDELIQERSALQKSTLEKCEEAGFNFCEH